MFSDYYLLASLTFITLLSPIALASLEQAITHVWTVPSKGTMPIAASSVNVTKPSGHGMLLMLIIINGDFIGKRKRLACENKAAFDLIIFETVIRRHFDLTFEYFC